MTEQIKTTRKNRFPAVAAILALFLGAAVTLAWLKPGFIECSGYLEPSDWVPVYTAGAGRISICSLSDGKRIEKGELLVELDDDRLRWNLDRIAQERKSLEAERSYLEESLNLFRLHRMIEEDELNRIETADRQLLENSSLSMNEYERTRYLRRTFIAGADREQAELEQQILRSQLESLSLRSEADIWQDRLDDCRTYAPISGRFYSAEAVLRPSPPGLIPPLGPGQSVDSGSLVGYLIPEGNMRARINIPQNRISGCVPGQTVLLSINARPLWRFEPVAGRLESIVAVASGGHFVGVVDLIITGETLKELRLLTCGDLTARIRINGRSFPASGAVRRFAAKAWDYWSIRMNTFRQKKEPNVQLDSL